MGFTNGIAGAVAIRRQDNTFHRVLGEVFKMLTRKFLRASTVLAALAMSTTLASATDPLLNGFDVLDTYNNTFRLLGSGTAVSGDGHTIAGTSLTATLQTAPVRWDGITGPILLGTSTTVGEPVAVDFDGNAIAGTLNPGTSSQRAFRWTAGGGIQNLGLLPGRSETEAMDISSDGTTVVGIASGGGAARAIRWKPGSGFVDLGLPAGTFGAGAWATNADGSVIVGTGINNNFFTNEAIRWHPGGADKLPSLPGGNGFTNALDVNDDGSVVVGWSYSSIAPVPQATRWVDGVATSLGFPAGSGSTQAAFVSGDGRVVAGSAGALGPFIWTENTGMRLLSNIIEELGIDTMGYNPTGITDMSSDGRVFSGTADVPPGAFPAETRAFRLVISEDIGIALVGDQEYAFSDATITGGGTVKHIPGGMSHGASAQSTGTLVEESNTSERTFLFAPNAIGDGDQNATVNALLEGLLSSNPGGSASVVATMSVLDELDNTIGTQTRNFGVADGGVEFVSELFALNVTLTPGETYKLLTELSVSAMDGSADFGDTFVVQFVPEPASAGLLIGGTLLILRRRH